MWRLLQLLVVNGGLQCCIHRIHVYWTMRPKIHRTNLSIHPSIHLFHRLFSPLTFLGYCSIPSSSSLGSISPWGVSTAPFICMLGGGIMDRTSGWFRSTWKSADIFLLFCTSNKESTTKKGSTWRKQWKLHLPLWNKNIWEYTGKHNVIYFILFMLIFFNILLYMYGPCIYWYINEDKSALHFYMQ